MRLKLTHTLKSLAYTHTHTHTHIYTLLFNKFRVKNLRTIINIIRATSNPPKPRPKLKLKPNQVETFFLSIAFTTFQLT